MRSLVFEIINIETLQQYKILMLLRTLINRVCHKGMESFDAEDH